MTVKSFFSAVWQFCSYLFWPRWGGKSKKDCYKRAWISSKENGLASVEVLAHFLVNRSVKAASVIIYIEVMLVSTKNNCWMNSIFQSKCSDMARNRVWTHTFYF